MFSSNSCTPPVDKEVLYESLNREALLPHNNSHDRTGEGTEPVLSMWKKRYGGDVLCMNGMPSDGLVGNRFVGLLMIAIFVSFFAVATALYNKPYPDVGLHESTYVCKLDDKVNAMTFASYKNEISSIWGASCARNRGIFVSNPPGT